MYTINIRLFAFKASLFDQLVLRMIYKYISFIASIFCCLYGETWWQMYKKKIFLNEQKLKNVEIAVWLSFS